MPLRRQGVVLLVAAAAPFLLTFGVWTWTGHVVPTLDGQEQLPGLKSQVQIDFDRYAIPHIYASSPEDGWAALGYLHGRERLWQMELYRRAASGRLSEIFGEQVLAIDRRFLRLGLRRAARDEVAHATPRVRMALDRYALGVNAALAKDGRWGLPLEFYALGFRPAPWDSVDSLAISKLMAWRLAENRVGELLRYRLADSLSPSEIAELMGKPPEWAPTIVGGQSAQSESRATAKSSFFGARGDPTPARWKTLASSVDSRLAVVLPDGLRWLTHSGGLSNSWVIAGSRTATGRPLLANDPHLNVEIPSLWYETHLVAGDLDVTGVTISGLPFVIIGHNRRIGWGLTNVGADVQDFDVEQLDSTRRRYLRNGAWLPLRTERHEIPVRSGAAQSFEVFETDHGAVANAADWDEATLDVREVPLSEHPLALRWDAMKGGDTSAAFDLLARAGNWDEFLTAIRELGAPAQNFVYADVDGNIGYAMSGLVPDRGAANGGGRATGGALHNESQRFLDRDRLPLVLNPSVGVIVTANNEVDRQFGHSITSDWVSPFRAARIWELIGQQQKIDVAATKRMQSDQITTAAAVFLPAVASALTKARHEKKSAAVLSAMERLSQWDRKADGRPLVTLYQSFMQALWRRTFEDELGEPLFEQFYRWAARERYAGLYMILDNPDSRWWDDTTTRDKRENRDDIITSAVEDAISTLIRKFGDEPMWAWDRLHAINFAHPLARGGRLLRWMFSRGPIPIGGDGETINKTMIDLVEPYGTTEMAAYRVILDVGGWDGSIAVIPTGQSGHPRSSHYFDQNPLWRSGDYHPQPYSREAVVKTRVSRLVLVP